MKILHISSILRPANGIYTVLLALKQQQISCGHTVKLVNALYSEYAKDLDLIEIVNKERFTTYIEDYSPDIVIFHSIYSKNFISFANYLNQRDIPYLIQLHGALSYQNYHKKYLIKKIVNLLFYNKFMKNAQSIIYLNESEYDNSIVKNINPYYDIIPNGCILPDDILPKEVTTNNKVEILYLGRIDMYHKALDILLDAIEILNTYKSEDRIHISFYGTGNEKNLKWFETRIRKLSAIADFYGPAYGETKLAVFKKSHIFILTSRYEGMPMGVLEALSFGIPCIVTPGTNMGEIICKNNAGWSTCLNSKDIAHCIIQAVEEYRGCNECYQKASRSLAAQFNWEKIAIQSIRVYEKYLKSK